MHNFRVRGMKEGTLHSHLCILSHLNTGFTPPLSQPTDCWLVNYDSIYPLFKFSAPSSFRFYQFGYVSASTPNK